MLKKINVKKLVKNLKNYVYTYTFKQNSYALVLPNQIVVYCQYGHIQIWDNDRRYSEHLFGDGREYAFNRILEVIAGWYEDDLEDKVFKRQRFIMPNGMGFPTSDLNVPFSDEGYPAISSSEMYQMLVGRFGCGDIIWSEKEASELFNKAVSELKQESIERHHLN